MSARLRMPVGLALALFATAHVACAAPGAADRELRERVTAKIAAEYRSIETIYKHLHANPELSFMEEKTAALVARELRAVGCEVTEKVGVHGVVGVLRNGPGPTVLLRADMDALPVKEATDLPYASKAVVKDLSGNPHPAMHACGHDLHIAGLIGTARTLAAVKERWTGTVVLVAQPAEEILAGARAMLTDGLYTRFPKPDHALALHVSSGIPAGTIGYVEGPAYASSTSVDIVVRGVGGHGSQPHNAKDPVVLAAQIVLALQTIVSRELQPGTPAVVTVGTIHGGTKRNIISDEVKLELTLRCFDMKVAAHLVASIRRICAGMAQAAGLPENRAPVVTVTSGPAPVTINDPELTRRLVRAWGGWLGEERLQPQAPRTVSEDFSEYGRTVHRVPICMWQVGAADPVKHAESQRTGVALPSNHSPHVTFVPDPTLSVCVTSMTAAVLELMPKM